MGYSNPSPSQRSRFCTSTQISLCSLPIQVSFENRKHQCLATLRHMSSLDIFQQHISSHPFILCRPNDCLLGSSSKTNTNKQKTGSATTNKLIQITNTVPLQFPVTVIPLLFSFGKQLIFGSLFYSTFPYVELLLPVYSPLYTITLSLLYVSKTFQLK